jgi:LPS sulfotransferase NodH
VTGDLEWFAEAMSRLSVELLQRRTAPTSRASSPFHPAVNVVGVGVGERVVGGRATGTPAIQLLVARKADLADLARGEVLPTVVDGIPTDVVEVGVLHALHGAAQPPAGTGAPRARGVAVRRDTGLSPAPRGTVGAVVHAGSQPLLLTTRGVFATAGRCDKDLPAMVRPDDGEGQGENAERWVPLGALARTLPFCPVSSVDGAVTTIDLPLLGQDWFRRLDCVQGSGTSVVGSVVHKVGAESGYTTGLVVGVTADVVVRYDDGPRVLGGQILVRSLDPDPFALPGDSGALLVEQRTGLAVGMIVAGSGRICVANHLDDVLDGLGVALGPPRSHGSTDGSRGPRSGLPAAPVPAPRPFRPRLPVVCAPGQVAGEIEHRPCRSATTAGRRLAPWEAGRATRRRRTPQPRMPTASYFLCCLPRSGSWLLADGLKATGVAGLPEEYYWDDFYHDYLEQWGGPDITSYADFLSLSQRFGSTGNGVFGAKLHWGELVHLGKQLRTLPGTAGRSTYELLTRYFPNPRFVYLSRQDKVRQAISWFRAATTAGWYSVDGESTGGRREVAPDWSRIGMLERALRADEDSWHKFFALARIEPLRITYEDLSADYERGIRDTLRYLQLTPSTPAGHRPTRLSVQRDASTEEWVQTYLSERRRTAGPDVTGAAAPS